MATISGLTWDPIPYPNKEIILRHCDIETDNFGAFIFLETPI
jgi:hypothetical protein